MLLRSTILQALSQLSDELEKRGILGEINLVRGTAMVLAFNARQATKDVDAIFQPSAEIRATVAETLGLPHDWLNDAAKGFASATGDFVRLPSIDMSNLRVLAPTPEYMLAMKVLASRAALDNSRGDASDIAFLIRLLKLRNAGEVMTIVSRYYDPSQILPRSHCLVDEILENLSHD